MDTPSHHSPNTKNLWKQDADLIDRNAEIILCMINCVVLLAARVIERSLRMLLNFGAHKIFVKCFLCLSPCMREEGDQESS